MSDVDRDGAPERAGDGGGPERRQRPAGRPEAPRGGTGEPGPEQFPGEVRGPKGPEPTRFGDWEKGGRCFDF